MADDNSNNNGQPTSGISKLVEEFNSYEKKARRSKHNRTMSLDVDNFLKLHQYCREKHIPVSEVVDRLIDQFISALEKSLGHSVAAVPDAAEPSTAEPPDVAALHSVPKTPKTGS